MRRFGASLLPKCRRDALNQVGLFLGAYVLYQVVRGVVNANDAPARAAWNATRIIDFERGLHVFLEPRIQHWALHFHTLMACVASYYRSQQHSLTNHRPYTIDHRLVANVLRKMM